VVVHPGRAEPGRRFAAGGGAVKALARRPWWWVALGLSLLAPLDVLLVWWRVIPESYLRFGRPALAPVGVLAMAFVAWRSIGSTTRGGPLRRGVTEACSALTVLATALAAMSPEFGLPLDRMAVVVVIDRSRSMDLVPKGEERIARELSFVEGGMRDDDRIGRVVFAADAASEELPRTKAAPSSPQRVELGRDASDIAAGIRRALADVPADSAARLVVLSDGVATRGDAWSAAAAATTSGVPIDVITLEQRELKDVRLVSLRLPSAANDAEPVRLRVVVSTPEATEVELRVRRDGELVRRVRAKVDAGENVLPLVEPSPGPGLHRYDVEVGASDPKLDECAEDNGATAFVRVRGAARALVLDGDPGKTSFVAGALRSAKFEVVEGSVSSLPADVAGMAAFDLLVFGDIAANALSAAQLDGLAAYVRDLGGGLVLFGGDRSFGPGGYAKTALEEVSPVSFDLKQDRRRASLAEVIAIDISGSMAAQVGARTKLELANEAAARSAALLGAGDRLGVDHVDTISHWSVPLAPVLDAAAIEKAIRAAGPGGGGILVDVALADAYAALDGVTVNLKHVLLFADGSDAEAITPAVKASVASAERRGITTSVVALGHGPDVPDCEALSRLGKGRFYIVEDATRLPAIFTQETVLASRSALLEEPFRVARGVPHQVLSGIDLDAAPSLGGYVVTIPKPRADVVLTGPEQDPVLALWQVGVGQAAAFTSDLKDRWGSDWTHWEGAARLIAQTARAVARREDDARVRLEAQASSGQLELRATVVDDDGRLATFRRLKAAVRGPEGYSREVALEAAGPGSYRATVSLTAPGAYVATAQDELDGTVVATAGAALSRGEELRPTGSDPAFLARLAELTGGKRRDTLAGVFSDRAARRFGYVDVTTPLLAFAAFAWLFAVAARRLAVLDEVGPWLQERRRRVSGDRTHPTTRSKGSLGADGEGSSLALRLKLQRSARTVPRAATSETSTAATPALPVTRVPTVGPPHEATVPAEKVSLPTQERDAPAAPSNARSAPAQEGERVLTAAEILLARKKGRK